MLDASNIKRDPKMREDELTENVLLSPVLHIAYNDSPDNQVCSC